MRSTRVIIGNFTKVSHGRDYPDLGTYRRLRGLLGVPVHVPVVCGVVGPVHPVVFVDFVRILESDLKMRVVSSK